MEVSPNSFSPFNRHILVTLANDLHKTSKRNKKRKKRKLNRTHLHSNGEVVTGFRREEHVDGFLGERLILRRWLSNLDNVQLRALHCPHGEAEQIAGLGVTLHLEIGKGRGVALDRLGAFSLDGVELHGADDAIVVR